MRRPFWREPAPLVTRWRSRTVAKGDSMTLPVLRCSQSRSNLRLLPVVVKRPLIHCNRAIGLTGILVDLSQLGQCDGMIRLDFESGFQRLLRCCKVSRFALQPGRLDV